MEKNEIKPNDKLKLLVTKIQQNEDLLKKGIDQLIKTLPMMIEYSIYRAKLSRATYDSLIAEGFNPQQALSLTEGFMK